MIYNNPHLLSKHRGGTFSFHSMARCVTLTALYPCLFKMSIIFWVLNIGCKEAQGIHPSLIFSTYCLIRRCREPHFIQDPECPLQLGQLINNEWGLCPCFPIINCSKSGVYLVTCSPHRFLNAQVLSNFCVELKQLSCVTQCVLF